MNEYIETLGKNAKTAAPFLVQCDTQTKNNALSEIARRLDQNAKEIIEANKLDVENARKNGMSEALIDRLTLDEKRIAGMVDGIDKVVALPDPIGELLEENTLPNGLKVKRVRVPMGVIGIIFESRPNVTVDAAALCFKAGSAVILRGGSDAINSNNMLVGIMREAVAKFGAPEDCIQ